MYNIDLNISGCLIQISGWWIWLRMTSLVFSTVNSVYSEHHRTF